jgi:MoaA/NifB/PqqE/SkfB family radical SAM enzyme
MIEARGSYLRLARERLRDGRFPWLVNQGLRTASIALADRLHLPPLTGPLLGTLVVTYRCNYNCPMCPVASEAGQDELDTAAVESLVDEFAAMGTPGLAITGGEPLLRDDVIQIIRRARSHGMVVNLSTNGHLLTEDHILDRLVGDPPDNVNVSLDSALPEWHDRLRGFPGSFERVVEGIRGLVARRAGEKASFHITLVSVLTERSFSKVNDLCRLAEELGVDAVGFIPYHSFAGTKREIDPRSWGEITAGVEALIARKRAGSRPWIDNTRRYLKTLPLAMAGVDAPVRCSSGYTTCYVDAHGDVFGCWPHVELRRPIGNVKDSSLRSIWRSADYARLRREMRTCRACYWNCQTELNLLFSPFQQIPDPVPPVASCGAMENGS